MRSLLLLLVVACSSATADAPPATDLPTSEIDAAVTAAMAEQHIPGVSIAIVRDHQLVYASGYGLADLENAVVATADTSYRFASVSKTFTAAAAMELAEAGTLDLDAEIQTYVPSFPHKPWPITARELLCHQAGIRHYGDEPENYRHWDNVTDPLELFANDPLLFQPGTSYTYSSYGYNLLGAV